MLITIGFYLFIPVDTFAKSAGPDDMVVISHQIRISTVCHSVFDFGLRPLFAVMNVSRVRYGRVHFNTRG